MQRRGRVLIVDDSVVIRSLLTRVLSESPDIEVVGTSANGRLALRRLAKEDVDVVILDVDMPELDGLSTLRILRQDHPQVRVIMFSTLTEAGATATIESLALGAYDYVTKPSATNNAERTAAAVREELARKVHVACFGEALRRTSQVQRPDASPSVAPSSPVDVIAIGASTGGPNALTQIVSELPADFPVPILIVQHMPIMFTRIFAERLNGLSALSVREATDGARIERGSVWIAPGGAHMLLVRDPEPRISLNYEPPVNFCRPSVDVLFRSVASAYGPRALCAVLTGMGHDGLHGAEVVRRLGGRVFAQDQQTSVVWGMPGYVVRAQLAHEILPLPDLAGALTACVANSRSSFRVAPAALEGSRA
ncbi:MAG TPA: chemotaxis response regulator protein-glutamate methylesterase [Polyangiaceae bacterium]